MSKPDNSAAIMEAAARQYRVAEFRGVGGGDFQTRVVEAWRLLREWYSKSGFNEDVARPIADLGYSAMSVFSGMSPENVAILDTLERGWISEPIAALAREKKQALIASLPDLAAFYTERDRRAAETDKLLARHAQQRQAEFDAAAPARLLAKLRSGGAQIALDGGKITLAVGTLISHEDHAMVKEHKAGLVAILKQEEAAARPMVLA